MKTYNYGSHEVCQRLVDAGIVLETEAWWGMISNNQWILQKGDSKYKASNVLVPAPSMVEVWRSLPLYTNDIGQYMLPNLVKVSFDLYSAFYSNCDGDRPVPQVYQNNKSTDALIDLLIWVRTKEV